jgi:hypothetical protein
MMKKFFEFLAAGIFTPILYLLYTIGVVLIVFVIGLPFGIAIYLINLAITFIFGGILNANL